MMDTREHQSIGEDFVGRRTYLEEFHALLRNRERRVFFIHGPGGIGKTWLLRKIMEEARLLPDLLVPADLIDMYSTTNHRMDGVQDQVITLLNEVIGPECFAQFRETRHDLEVSRQQGLSHDTLHRMQEWLDNAFVQGCERILGARPVLFLDTFERVQDDIVGDWVMQKLVPNLPNFVFVIASRQPREETSFIRVLELKGFTPEEAGEYFRKRGLPDDMVEALAALHSIARGHPLLMELAIEWLEGGLLRTPERLQAFSWEEFEEAMVAPLREMAQGLFGEPDLDAVVYSVLLLMAYMNRRFNAGFLDRLVSKSLVDLKGRSSQDVVDLVGAFRFAKRRPEGDLQLHDEVERLILRYLWPPYDPSGEFRRELCGIVIQWYDDLIAGAPHADIADDLRAERLGYILRRDPQEGLRGFNALFIPNYEQGRHGLCEAAANEIRRQDFSVYAPREQYDLHMHLAMLAYRLHRPEQMLQAAEAMKRLGEETGDPEALPYAYIQLYEAIWRKDPARAATYLQQALPFGQQSVPRFLPRVLHSLGFISRNMGNLEEAVTWFEKCMEVSREQKEIEYLARALNDLGYCYATQGIHQKAGRYVRQALKLRLRQGEVSRWAGWSYNTLGEVSRYAGDLAGAEAYYSRAAEIGPQVGDRELEAIALHSLGDTQRRIALATARRGDEAQTTQYRKAARQSFSKSIDLYARWGLTRGKATLYRRWGRLLQDEGNVRAARQQFELGLRFAEEEQNTLEILENLSDIALVAAQEQDEGTIRRCRARIEQHRRPVYLDKVFPFLLDIAEAELRCQQGAYDQALDLYIRGLAGLAEDPGYGSTLYGVHRGRLLNNLAALPNPEDQHRWCDRIIEAWKEKGLGTAHPDLVVDCELHRDMIDLL
jgi:tetratricopeptide (TPR) repeat protein